MTKTRGVENRVYIGIHRNSMVAKDCIALSNEGCIDITIVFSCRYEWRRQSGIQSFKRRVFREKRLKSKIHCIWIFHQTFKWFDIFFKSKNQNYFLKWKILSIFISILRFESFIESNITYQIWSDISLLEYKLWEWISHKWKVYAN